MPQRIFHLCLTLALACCLLAPAAEAKENPEAVRKAAEAGDPVAQTRLGLAYSSGEWNLEKNEQEALSWFNKAAESGYAPGQAGLCFAYIEGGQGVEKDETKAKEWCDKAAKALPALTGQGDVLAQFSLGVMYFRGLGVPENIGEAERLMRLVAEQGFALGQFMLAGIYVEKDEQEAANWLRKAAEQGLADAKEALDEMHKNARGLPQDDK